MLWISSKVQDFVVKKVRDWNEISEKICNKKFIKRFRKIMQFYPIFIFFPNRHTLFSILIPHQETPISFPLLFGFSGDIVLWIKRKASHPCPLIISFIAALIKSLFKKQSSSFFFTVHMTGLFFSDGRISSHAFKLWKFE